MECQNILTCDQYVDFKLDPLPHGVLSLAAASTAERSADSTRSVERPGLDIKIVLN